MMKLGRILLMSAILCLSAGLAHAEPQVNRKGDIFGIEEGVNEAILSQIKSEMGEVNPEKLGFYLEGINNDDLAKLCTAFPQAIALTLENSEELTSIAPVANLKGLRGISIYNTKIADLTPLAGLTELNQLKLNGDDFGPDLKWMSGLIKLTDISITADEKLVSFEGLPKLPELEEISLNGASPADLTPLLAMPALTNIDLTGSTIKDLSPLAKLPELTRLKLYGATVSDFSPLGGCLKLKELDYYATKGADYSTLGKLTQLENLQGGLTKLADISWVVNLQHLKEFIVFAEDVEDYAPLAKTKVEHFTIWKMNKPTNLTTLSGAVSLKYLRLWNLTETSGFEGLASLTGLKELIIDGVNEKEGTVDLAFIKTLTNLQTLTLIRSTVTKAEALGALNGLKKLEARELNAREGDPALDLSFLAKLKALENLNLTKSKVTNFEAIADCTALQYVTLTDASGLASLVPLKKLPNLKYLAVKKGAFSEAELSGFAETVKISQQ